MNKIKTKNAGFSLIELLFAMLFLSVIIFGVIKLQVSNLTLSNTKQLELKAHFYSLQSLEVLEAIGFAAISGCNAPCYLGENYAIENEGSESLENDLFARYFEHDETDLTNASLVTAVVEWEDSSGDHKVETKRIIYN